VKRSIKVGLISLAICAAVFGTAGSCESDASKSYEQRLANEKVVDPKRPTLEKANLQKKQKIDENPNQLGFVYLLSFGKPFGYYPVKGKISSSGSQLAPESEVLRPCGGGSCEFIVADGPQDDGTYGEGDPGIFFFTPDGNMVVTSLDYFYSQQPVAFGTDVLDLSKKG
jgi:hypothetical protein